MPPTKRAAGKTKPQPEEKKQAKLQESSIVAFLVREYWDQHTRMNGLRTEGFQLAQIYFSIAGLFVGAVTVLSKVMSDNYLSYFKYSFFFFFILFLFGHSIYQALCNTIRDELTMDTALFFIRAFFVEKGLLHPYVFYYNGPYKDSNFDLGQWHGHRDNVVYLTQFTGMLNIIILATGLASLFWALSDAAGQNVTLFIQLSVLVGGFVLLLALAYAIYRRIFYYNYIDRAEKMLHPIRKGIWDSVEKDILGG
ncbi:MAG: hypothetical protein WCP97_01335 [bacterium]